jgi:hypothetical protein
MSESSRGFAVAAPRSYAAASAVERRNGKHAVIVVHGMGQQATFETVSSLAQLVAGDEAPAAGVARGVEIGGERLCRLEMVLAGPEGTERETHFYEAYWAPLTEGRLTLRDVIRFLVYAGIGGLRSSLRKTFPRWAFGGERRYPVRLLTPLMLLATLLVVLAMIALNGVVVAAGSSRLFGPPKSWPGDGAFDRLSAVAGALAVVVLSFFTTLNSAARARANVFASWSRRFFAFAGWLHAALIAVTIIGAVVLMASVLGVDPFQAGHLVDRLARSSTLTLVVAVITLSLVALSVSLRPNGIMRAFTYVSIAWALCATGVIGAVLMSGWNVESLSFAQAWRWGWWFLLGATVAIRKVLVQYVGDVAAYVTPQSLDKFNDLRDEIKACVFKVGNAVYRAACDGVAEYEQVTVVGHSLGSVAAYDMLNRLLRDDATNGGALHIEERTRALVTFGSPLDKIAFLFGMGHKSAAARALSATVQPMIQRGARRFDWINLHSPHDVVSGALDYFNDPDRSVADVTNVIDESATTPLVAHVEYWSGTRLRESLRSLILSDRKAATVGDAVGATLPIAQASDRPFLPASSEAGGQRPVRDRIEVHS